MTSAGRVYHKGCLVGRIYYSAPDKCWHFRVSKRSTAGLDAQTRSELYTKLQQRYEGPAYGSKTEAEAAQA